MTPTSRDIARGRATVDVKALVTGAGGFAGQWLCRDLSRRGWSVTGTTFDGPPSPGVIAPEDFAGIAWRRDDLRENAAAAAALDAATPDAVFHLAGVAFVPNAGADPTGALELNVGATVRLLAALRDRRAAGTLDPVVVIVGSGEQYGRHDATAMPMHENTECRPRSFYAATKMAQEEFALEAFRSAGVRVICTRSFNHSGRGQAVTFLLPALVGRAIAAKNSGAPVPIGNTTTVRDFLHVEDVVRAYVLLAEHGLPGEVYNVCSGQGISVGDIAADVLAAVGARAALIADPALQRPVDVPILVGDNSKLRTDTGWAPQRSRADIISDLIHAASH